MQTGREFQQKVLNVLALVVATAISGLTLWGVVQMAATDAEILGAANVPWVYPAPPSAAGRAPEPSPTTAARLAMPS